MNLRKLYLYWEPFYFAAKFIFQFELETTKMNIEIVTDFAKVVCQNYFLFETWAYSLHKVLNKIRQRVDVLFFSL